MPLHRNGISSFFLNPLMVAFAALRRFHSMFSSDDNLSERVSSARLTVCLKPLISKLLDTALKAELGHNLCLLFIP